jgi:tetratricopeptide (TPR) repeat protein
MGRRIAALAFGAFVALLAACPAAAQPSASSPADEALALCKRAEEGGEARVDLLTRGLAIAERAVEADPADARAHFAVFCNLGRRIQATGLSVLHLFEVVRALRELDDAARLAPDDPDVVAAKGAVLASLPPVFGGDATAGEQWLRRALALDPNHREARAYLAAILSRRGADDVADHTAPTLGLHCGR